MADLFTLEAVYAKKGDALILHFGSRDDPKLVLIDGGPRGVYRANLRPRLDELAGELGLGPDDALRFELVMVSHIDDDHIAGIIDLLRDVADARDRQFPVPYDIGGLWHNSFDDLLGDEGADVASVIAAAAEQGGAATVAGVGLPLPPMRRESEAVLASTRQGRTLRDLARRLGVSVNAPFEGLVRSPAPDPVDLGHGLTLTVLGPDQGRIDEFRERWRRDLKKILAEEGEDGQQASFEDDSPFNLASITVLAELDGRSMLLTGDARGDFVLDWLDDSGLLDGGEFRTNLLKVPHHGSDRNVTTDFFRKVVADHYVVSGDGEHGNPERETLDMIQQARGGDRYAVHFTVTQDQHEHEQNAERKEALEEVAEWVAQAPPNVSVVFRQPGDGIHSITVPL